MKHISRALHLIINLNKIAIHHHKTCHDPDCGVSVFMVKKAAEALMNNVEGIEKEEAQRFIDEIPIA